MRVHHALWQGRTLWLAQRRPQDAVDKGRRALSAVFFRELHRCMTNGGRRNFIHEEKSGKAKAQKLSYGRLCLFKVGDIAANHDVERLARLHRAVDQLCQKAAVALRHLRTAQRIGESDIRVCALAVHAQEYLHRTLADAVDLFSHRTALASMCPLGWVQ